MKKLCVHEVPIWVRSKDKTILRGTCLKCGQRIIKVRKSANG